MRLHYQVSIKPILKNPIFSIILEPFSPLKGKKLKSVCSHSILVEIVQFFGTGLRYHRPKTYQKWSVVWDTFVFLIHPSTVGWIKGHGWPILQLIYEPNQNMAKNCSTDICLALKWLSPEVDCPSRRILNRYVSSNPLIPISFKLRIPHPEHLTS